MACECDKCKAAANATPAEVTAAFNTIQLLQSAKRKGPSVVLARPEGDAEDLEKLPTSLMLLECEAASLLQQWLGNCRKRLECERIAIDAEYDAKSEQSQVVSRPGYPPPPPPPAIAYSAPEPIDPSRAF